MRYPQYSYILAQMNPVMMMTLSTVITANTCLHAYPVRGAVLSTFSWITLDAEALKSHEISQIHTKLLN